MLNVLSEHSFKDTLIMYGESESLVAERTDLTIIMSVIVCRALFYTFGTSVIKTIKKVHNFRVPLAGAQLGGVEGGGRLSCPFLKIEKSVLILGKKGPDSVYVWVKYSIQNVVLRVSRRKDSKMFPAGSFLCF